MAFGFDDVTVARVLAQRIQRELALAVGRGRDGAGDAVTVARITLLGVYKPQLRPGDRLAGRGIDDDALGGLGAFEFPVKNLTGLGGRRPRAHPL